MKFYHKIFSKQLEAASKAYRNRKNKEYEDVSNDKLQKQFDLPVQITRLEQQYLKSVVKEPIIQSLLGEDNLFAIQPLLKGVQPLSVICEGSGSFTKKEIQNITILIRAIRERRQIEYDYRTNMGKEHYKSKAQPYKLMYLKSKKIWQIIMCIVEEGVPRIILCTLRRMDKIKLLSNNVLELSYEKVDRLFVLFLEERSKTLRLCIENYHTNPERCARMFRDYEYKME